MSVSGAVADDWCLVDLPVAGVKDVPEWRFDKQAVAFWNRVRQRDEAHPERPELDRSSALNDVELHLTGQPLFLELARDQTGGEWRRESGAFSSSAR